MKLLLDTGVLGQVVHPRRHAESRAWLRRVVAEHEVLVSEVCDYERRRELLRIGARRSIAHLDELGRELRYLPATTSTWRLAAILSRDLVASFEKRAALRRDVEGLLRIRGPGACR